MKKKKNVVFIDGQNLYLGTKLAGWIVDRVLFITYLRDKYNAGPVYYWMGYFKEEYRQIYDNLRNAGYILMFKEHDANSVSTKKGNVDVDIVFEIMRMVFQESDSFGKITLVSGDGDYKRTVVFLILIDKFEKILFPNERYASSLYAGLRSRYRDFLDRPDVKERIERKTKRKRTP